MARTAVSRAGGMTLIEVLVAMVILTVGATSLIALFASASSTHKRAIDRTHTALVAEELFSEVQARYFLDADPRDILEELKSALPERIAEYYWEVILYRPGDTSMSKEGGDGEWGEDELIVHVKVKWSRAAQAHEEAYTTILLPRPLGARR